MIAKLVATKTAVIRSSRGAFDVTAHDCSSPQQQPRRAVQQPVALLSSLKAYVQVNRKF